MNLLTTEFWNDHFNSTTEKGDCFHLKTVDARDVIRKHALGSFWHRPRPRQHDEGAWGARGRRQSHGAWPGLGESQLGGPGDLAVTTDYRDVLSEILTKRLNNPDLAYIFPNYQATLRGIVK